SARERRKQQWASTPPPELHSFTQNKPTLLVCWWITLLCATIIFLRVSGRFIRSEKLFAEDRTAALALIPLFLRMGCVHVILIYGTNNAQLPPGLSDEEMQRRSVGSGLVLASRSLHAATLWILKSAILDFFKRLTSTSWKRSHEVILLIIRCSLCATFVAVLISDLTECRPFRAYYQVLPDPGGQCRQGYAQLITMATCNVLTDLLLVFFPVSIIIRSHMKVKRKVQLVLLFSLSLGVVGVTLYRIPHVIWQHGDQQIRSLLASVEILMATTAANALVLGSFVRDRGVKKNRFRYGSVVAESIEGSALSARRPTAGSRHWGSDEDLRSDGLKYTPAPIAKIPDDMRDWHFPQRQRSNAERSDDSSLLPSSPWSPSRSNSSTTPRRVSFFDVGGLLEEQEQGRSVRNSYGSSLDPLSPTRSAPSPTMPATGTGFRRGSQALLQDLSGLLTTFGPKPQARPSSASPPTNSGTELETIPQHPRESVYDPADTRYQPALVDAGGLLK
ncbi:integral membrane protein PTH11, partial [Apiospora kogelbergensis]|uniref:integral membrane protein PTH11 n=1 Tax=Apiospora kogelbergensis TaxID=1337665 RepID=UPI00313242C7